MKIRNRTDLPLGYRNTAQCPNCHSSLVAWYSLPESDPDDPEIECPACDWTENNSHQAARLDFTKENKSFSRSHLSRWLLSSIRQAQASVIRKRNRTATNPFLIDETFIDLNYRK